MAKSPKMALLPQRRKEWAAARAARRAAWNEQLHPRWPKGMPTGGQFKNGTKSALAAARQKAERTLEKNVIGRFPSLKVSKKNTKLARQADARFRKANPKMFKF